MFENENVRKLKDKYDELLTKRVKQYLCDKGFDNKSVAKTSDKAKSYKVMVTFRQAITLIDSNGTTQKDRSDTNVLGITYGISRKALLNTDFSNIDSQGLARTKALIPILTRSYIKQVINLISEIRDEVGKSSLLVNKLSRVMLDIVHEFYRFSMQLSAEDVHEKYEELLKSSDNYIALAVKQVNSLGDACQTIEETARELGNGMIKGNVVDLLNSYVEQAINQLNQTISKIKEYIVADATENIQNLKAKFIMFSKYATPLQYNYQCKAIIDSNDASALFHKEMAQYIFRETVDIYIKKLLPNFELKALSTGDNAWFSELLINIQQKISSSDLYTDDVKKEIEAEEDLVSYSNLEDLESDFDDLKNVLDPFVEQHIGDVDEVSKQKEHLANGGKKQYINSLINFLETNKSKGIGDYSSNKIETEFFSDEISDDFHNKVLLFNLINFICGISTKLLSIYGEQKITDQEHIELISQQLHITTNFSQDIMTTLEEPMTKQQFSAYGEALSNEMKRYHDYKDGVLSSLERYQSLPERIEQIGKVLTNMNDNLGGGKKAVAKLKSNVEDIKNAVDKQLKIVGRQAELLSNTLANIKSATDDIKTIETAKIERLRTFSPDLQDAENRAQYYILNALAETQSETAQNVSSDIKGLRNRALNFVKMTAVMNFIVKYGLVGKTSLDLTVVLKNNTRKSFSYRDFEKLELKENILTIDNKSIADDFPGLFQYCYLGALKKASDKCNGRIEFEGSPIKNYEFSKVFPADSNYIDFMISYYYIQILFPFLTRSQHVFKIYMQVLALMEGIFISWISNIQDMLSKKEQFKMMKKAYLSAMDSAMRDMHSDHLESQKNMTIFQSMSKGSKKAVSWVGELFVKDSSVAKVGKTFKNYNVKAKHIEDFYQIFATKYKDEIGSSTTVNLPMVLLVASDLSVKAVKDKEVDMIKVLFAGAITGGVAGLIGVSKFKSVLAGLTASTVYGLGSWVCNSFSNYPNDSLRVKHLREANNYVVNEHDAKKI